MTDLHEHDASEDPPNGREAVAAGALTAAMHVYPAHQVAQVVPNHKEQLLMSGTITGTVPEYEWLVRIRKIHVFEPPGS